MKRLASLLVLGLVLAAGPSLAAADAPDHILNNAGATTTLDCGDGGKVIVNGADNTVTITGGCSKVQVNGSGNTVAIAAVDKIGVSGSGNTVSWAAGYKKKSPKVARSGLGNTVTRSK